MILWYLSPVYKRMPMTNAHQAQESLFLRIGWGILQLRFVQGRIFLDAYNKITIGMCGITAPISAKAKISINVKLTPAQVKEVTALQLYLVDGQRFNVGRLY